MNSHEILASADERIVQHRTTEVELRLVDTTGVAISGADVHVRLTNHAFKFGCNAFGLGRIDDEQLQSAYNERFKSLLNYATLPFYWGDYERSPGETQEDRLREMAAWCAENGIATKGHPLVWHEVFPRWAHELPDDEVLSLLEQRVRAIVSGFQGQVDIWDVVNEATVSHRFDNAVGRWIAKEGAAHCVEQALRWAHEANPDALLCYNDFNVSDDFKALLTSLLDRDAPMDLIGIQSHMHKGTWSLEAAWDTCETYARFGLPLHATELTVVSGRLKNADDNDWHKRLRDWRTTPEGEAAYLTTTVPGSTANSSAGI